MCECFFLFFIFPFPLLLFVILGQIRILANMCCVSLALSLCPPFLTIPLHLFKQKKNIHNNEKKNNKANKEIQKKKNKKISTVKRPTTHTHTHTPLAWSCVVETRHSKISVNSPPVDTLPPSPLDTPLSLCCDLSPAAPRVPPLSPSPLLPPPPRYTRP